MLDIPFISKYSLSLRPVLSRTRTHNNLAAIKNKMGCLPLVKSPSP